MDMRRYFLGALAAIGLFSCSPKVEDVTYEDLDLNVSYRQDGSVFTQYKTYSLPDSVYIITGDDDNLDSFARKDVDITILEEIEKQMDGYGYTKVDTSSNPDVGLLVSRLIIDHKGGGFSPGYCYPGWGWGWGYPGSGWCYPGYGYTYNYSTGSILIDMVDFKNHTPDGETSPELPWRYIANGYLNDNAYVFNTNRLKANVARGFEQSPYLRTE